MPVEIITKEDLNYFRIQLLDDLKKIIQQKNSPQKVWLKSPEVRKILGISPGTLQTLRIKGTLRCAKIGGMLFYKYEDIEKLLNNNMS
ncbi:MAG: helix-turn-helix domain-containing protein [Dyadobacter sp.]